MWSAWVSQLESYSETRKACAITYHDPTAWEQLQRERRERRRERGKRRREREGREGGRGGIREKIRG